jgi:hypothetical protein
MTDAMSSDPEVAYALVCLRSGELLEALDGAPLSGLSSWARPASELLRAGQMADLAPLFARLGTEQTTESFHEIVLVSSTGVRVMQRMLHAPSRAILAVSRDPHKLAMMLSGVRVRAQSSEARP